jgi:hypothetical protein
MVLSNSLQVFVEQVDPAFDRERLASFWGLEDALRQLLAGPFATQALNHELQELVANPSYTGPWRPNQLMLHRGRGFALTIHLYESSRRYVHSQPFLAMLAPLAGAPLAYTRYELPADYRNDVFNPALRIHSPTIGEVAVGELLCLHSDRYLYDFHIETPVPVLRLSTAPFHSMEWLFNRETGYAWQANDSEITATQLRVAAYILGKLADPSSVEPLKQLSEHPHHAVRWAAVQSLGRINRSAAVEKLKASVDDPHPHIRRAAAKTLAQLKDG